MTIRNAIPRDARAIAEVHVAAWESAYRGLMPDEILDEQTVDTREEQWNEWLRAGETRTLVAGEVDGFVTFWETSGEIAALYIAPDRTRRGIGTALLHAAHTALIDAGRDRAHLWVIADNHAARAFYERHGYAADGERVLYDGTGPEVIRLHRSLAARG